MLPVHIPGTEQWDERTETFVHSTERTLLMEHSLLSVAKWESKWHKPFLSDKDDKTEEESMDYLRCMTIGDPPPLDEYYSIPMSEMKKINDYIRDSMTATWFSDKTPPKKGREVVTNEVIYYWMTALQIPFECEKWHLNRLLTLVRVCNEKNAPAKKMSKKDIMKQNAALNAARKAKLNTKG